MIYAEFYKFPTVSVRVRDKVPCVCFLLKYNFYPSHSLLPDIKCESKINVLLALTFICSISNILNESASYGGGSNDPVSIPAMIDTADAFPCCSLFLFVIYKKRWTYQENLTPL